MKLKLTAYSQDPQIDLRETTKVLEDGGLTIGRGKENDWVLPDPHRHLSKNHCLIEFIDGQFTVTDTSSNGVFLNNSGEPLGRDNSALLQDGDQLRLGPYEIEVRLEEAGDFAFDEPYAQERTMGPGAGLDLPEPYDEPAAFDEPGPAEEEGDPFRKRPSVGPGSRPAGFDPFGSAFDGVDKDSDSQFDRFGIGAEGGGEDDLGLGENRAPGGRRGHPDDPFSEPSGHRAPRSIIPEDADLFGPEGGDEDWEGHSVADHVPDEHQAFSLPKAQPRPARGAAPPAQPPFAEAPPPFEEPEPEPFAEPDETPLPPSDRREPSPFETSPGTPAPGRRSTIPDDWDDFGPGEPEDDLPAPEEPKAARPRAGRDARAGPPPPPPAPPGAEHGPDRPPARPTPSRRARPEPAAPPVPSAGAGEPFHPSTIAPRAPAPGGGRARVRAARAEGAEPAGGSPSGDPVRSFLAACGLEESGLSDEAAEKLLYRAGGMMREMVQGLIDVLKVRASIRDEFRVSERTMIRPTENNPFKFSVDVDDAMQALLVQPRHGYLSPERATREAFNDLKAHQLAVMTGMQVALTALLHRFNPDALERRLEQQSVWDSILPSARKARYWELFRELYEEIAREAEDDFHGLFGKEFTKAYEKQLTQAMRDRPVQKG